MTVVHHISKVMVVKRRVEKKQIESKHSMNKTETNQVVSIQDELNKVVRTYIDCTLTHLGPELGSVWDQYRQEEVHFKADFKQSIKTLFECYCREWNLNCQSNDRFIVISSSVCSELGISVIEMDMLEDESTDIYSIEWKRIHLMSVLSNLERFRRSEFYSYWTQKYSNIGLHPEYEQYVMVIDVTFNEQDETIKKLNLYCDSSVGLYIFKTYLGLLGRLQFVDGQIDHMSMDPNQYEPIDFYNHLSKLDLTKYGLSGVGFEWTE